MIYLLIAAYLIPTIICWILFRIIIKAGYLDANIQAVILTLCPIVNVAFMITLVAIISEESETNWSKFFGL